MKYTLFTLPHGFSQTITTDQVIENSQVFIERIPTRIRLIEDLVRHERPAWTADKSEASLKSLGEWYSHHIQEYPTSAEERECMHKTLDPKWAILSEVHISFTAETLSYGLDIAVYLGECLRARCPQTFWRRGKNRKIDKKRTVLAGFQDNLEYDPVSFCLFTADVLGRSLLKKRQKYEGASDPKNESLLSIVLSFPSPSPGDILSEHMKRWLKHAAH